jgi:AraC-like DNA-binding protein
VITPIRVERQESELGSSTLALCTPSAALRDELARGYVGFVERTEARGSWIEPPRGTVTMILNLGEAFGGLPEAFVAGVSDTHAVVERGGSISCIDLKLTPPGAYRLLGIPMGEVSGRVVDVGDVLGAPGRRLVEALREAPSWETRFELVDAFLLERLAGGTAPAPAVLWAWRRLVDGGGRLPIGVLAGDVGWSRRHLIARFRQQIGLAPKMLARIVRFDGVLRALEAGAAPRWAEMAVDHGYYDQAHLIRDVREFTGMAPTELLARLGPGGGIAGDEVTSVQDTRTAAAYPEPLASASARR